MPEFPQYLRGQSGLGRNATAEDTRGQVARARGGRADLFGQVGEIAGKIQDVADQAKLARVAAEISAGMNRTVFDLEADPDIDTHGERWEKSREALMKGGREQLPQYLHGALDDRLFTAGAQSKLSIDNNVRVKRIANANADIDKTLQLTSDEAAQTQDPIRRAQIKGSAVGMLDGALRGGVIDQAKYDAAVRGFDRSISSADFRSLVAKDPIAAYRRLKEPNDPLGQGFSEAERAQMRSQALDEFQQQMAQERSAINFQQSQEDRQEAEEQDKVRRDADDALYKGDINKLGSILSENRDLLTPEQRRWYYEEIRNGGRGGSGAAKSNPGVYLDLQNRADGGEDVTGAADDAYRKGNLTQSDRDQIVKVSRESRFADARKLIREISGADMLNVDFARRAKGAQISFEFSQWQIENPKATREDALKRARSLLLEANFDDGRDDLKPSYAVRPSSGGDIDIQATALATQAAFEAGQINEEQMNEQKARIIREQRRIRDRQALRDANKDSGK